MRIKGHRNGRPRLEPPDPIRDVLKFAQRLREDQTFDLLAQRFEGAVRDFLGKRINREEYDARVAHLTLTAQRLKLHIKKFVEIPYD